MRKIAFAFLLLTSTLFNFSCTQDDDVPTPTYPIQGLWIGTYSYNPGTSGVQTPQYLSFIIKPNGALIVETTDAGNNYMATGTWTMVGTTLECKYIYTNSALGVQLRQMATATFSNSGSLTNGTWTNTNSTWQPVSDPNQKGTFSMQRVN